MVLMNIATVWKGSNARKKKTRSRIKPKIRWELLGLSDPDLVEPTAIETIRREVSSLASRGLEHGTHSGSTEQDPKGRGGNRQSAGKRVRRRGATE